MNQDRRSPLGQRVALKNSAVVRLVIGHFAAVIAEWAAVIGVLVHVFDRHGTRATALASIAMLVAALIVAPFAGHRVDGRRPQRVRLAGLVVQAAGYGAAAAAVFADLPVVVAVAAAMLALGAVTTLRPSGAVLMPAHVRSSEELVVGNLWIWYAESFSVLGGPLLAAVLLAVGGPAAVLTGCAAAALVGVGLTLVDTAVDPPARGADDDAFGKRGRRRLSIAWRSMRSRPGLTSVLAVVWGQYVMIGALDIVLVVLARMELGMGDAGPGVLGTAFGLGAVASVFGATFVLRRSRLAPVLLVALAVLGISFTAFGLTLSVSIALIVLPIVGVSRSMLDGPSRMLLQRSAGPEALGSVFAVRELCSASGLIAGSVFALVALEFGDAGSVLVGLGAFFAVLLVVTGRGLRQADEGADVPVVEMSLLRRLPMFAPLPPISLEAVARSASSVTVEPETVVITQGDPGEVFYAVIDGTFEVNMSGVHIRTAERFSFFGEVALLSDVARTATVTASSRGSLLAIDRVAFLVAVTGTDSSRQAAWGVVHALALESDVVPNDALLGATDGETET
ncbi:MAG: cyclic nucleotide-binding domain-containing protein [Acidimicrobiia bacterium]